MSTCTVTVDYTAAMGSQEIANFEVSAIALYLQTPIITPQVSNFNVLPGGTFEVTQGDKLRIAVTNWGRAALWYVEVPELDAITLEDLVVNHSIDPKSGLPVPIVPRSLQDLVADAQAAAESAEESLETLQSETTVEPTADKIVRRTATGQVKAADPVEDDDVLTRGAGNAAYGNVRPRGRRIILIGDSLTSNNGGTSTATPAQSLGGYSSKGMWRWANIMMGQALDIIGNSGIGGQEASQVAARFQTDVLDHDPDIVAILAGSNDDGAEDATWAHLYSMYEAALAAGVFVIAFTIPPTTNGALADYRQGVNDLIRDYARAHNGVLVVDLAYVWQDHDEAGFVGRSDYLLDGVHPGTLGAQVAGFAIAQALVPLLPPTVQDISLAVAPFNMLANGRFAGSGTSLGTGWAVGAGAPSFAYVSGPGGVGQRLAVTVPVGGFVVLRSNIAHGVLLRVGDEFDFTVTIEPYDLEVRPAGSQRINVRTQNYNGSSFSDQYDAIATDGGSDYGNARYPAARGVFRTQRGTFTSGKTLMQVVVSINGGGTYLISDAVARNLTMIESGLLAPEDVTHTNKITNGQFETDATGWSGAGTSPATVARVTTDKHSGSACLQITHTAYGNSDGRFSKVTIDAAKHIDYVAWVKAPAGHLGRLYFNWYVGGGSYLSNMNVPFTGTGNWQKIIGTVPVSSIPGTAGELLFAIGRGDATGTPVVLADDIDVWQT